MQEGMQEEGIRRFHQLHVPPAVMLCCSTTATPHHAHDIICSVGGQCSTHPSTSNLPFLWVGKTDGQHAQLWTVSHRGKSRVTRELSHLLPVIQ